MSKLTKKQFDDLKAGVETVIAGQKWVRYDPEKEEHQTIVDEWII